jgi:leucyl-tRNA synthetase
VLANEQVIDGRGWRSGALVEKREIPMYYLRITDYADELLAYLDKMPGWPERVKTMQANWIGKSEGVRFAFTHDIRDDDGNLIGGGRMYVFTTRADTIFGVTFCAVAAEHPLAQRAAKSNPRVAAFIAECQRGSVMEADLATLEKKGVPTGLFVEHPLTGEKIEIWVANYVLMSYGDGAVMGVPAHDERDFAFAQSHGLPIKQVLENTLVYTDELRAKRPRSEYPDLYFDATKPPKPWYTETSGVLTINSGEGYNGLTHEEAVEKVADALAAKGLGEKKVTFRLRDWGISRQRYWGTPIPIVHCPSCGAVPVPEEDLPVLLPEDCVPDGSGNPLAKRADFVDTSCPRCEGRAKRETDTMDTFVDSSWYFMRYACPDAAAMIDRRNDYWNPMDQYIGGITHAILHLLYARFWTKVMRDMGMLHMDEPFTRLLTQGMVLNHSYFRRTDKGGIDYFPPDAVAVEHDASGRVVGAHLKSDGKPVEYGGLGTMSKSKLNGVDPQDMIDRYGADAARLFVMFAAHPEATLEWSDAGVEGAHRFLRRMWTFGQAHAAVVKATADGYDWNRADASVKAARREIHLTLKQATYDYQRIQYNTVVSAGMKILNAIEAAPADVEGAAPLVREGASILIRVLYPVVPHVACALWQELGLGATYKSLLDAQWPQVDPAALAQDEIELVLQVNGKLRGKIVVPATADRTAIEAAARASPEVVKHAAGVAVKKVVVVPGRLVNVVV